MHPYRASALTSHADEEDIRRYARSVGLQRLYSAARGLAIALLASIPLLVHLAAFRWPPAARHLRSIYGPDEADSAR